MLLLVYQIFIDMKIKLLPLIAFGAILLPFGNASAQNHPAQFGPHDVIRCMTTENETILRQQNPKRANTEEFENWLAPKITQIRENIQNGKTAFASYKIPVVIHIIHDGDNIGSGENITDAQAISQITVMNNDYRRLSGTPGGANTTNKAVDCEIEFCLAKYDPNGDITTGIVRHKIIPYTDNVSNGFGGRDWETRNDVEQMKANTIWDPTKYLNMWVFRPGGQSLQNGGLDNLLGYAQFPSQSGLDGLNNNGGSSQTDGVVAGYFCFGSADYDDGTFNLNAPYNEGRTMTHEVGHWLGLRHIWGDGGCSIDDYCSDTPRAGDANYQCNPNADTCPSYLGRDMIQNYMDYTPDGCMDTFTQNQKERMHAVMQNSPRRYTLNNAVECRSLSNTNNPEEFKGINLFPNPTEDNVFFSIPSSIKIESLKIYNSIGQLVYSQEINSISNNLLKIDLTNFSNGIYLINLTKANASQMTYQVTKR